MPFQNIIEFPCECLCFDVQDSTGSYLTLRPCRMHAAPGSALWPALAWCRMYGQGASPRNPLTVLAAISAVALLVDEGTKFRKLKAILSD